MTLGGTARQILAIAALPGLVAGVVPWLLLPLDPWRRQGNNVAGAALAGVGLLVLAACIGDFWRTGRGTLAPWDPPTRLVVVGLYRFMRNPMYLGVLCCVAGWAALAGSPLLLGYLLVLGVGFHLRVLLHEEPWLARQFAAEWAEYKAAVPRWAPRLRPWLGRAAS
jgi:protein-S-isoprenylcysteine O-methyltransferase Ste14